MRRASYLAWCLCCFVIAGPCSAQQVQFDRTELPFSPKRKEFVAGDFNRDGRADLVAISVVGGPNPNEGPFDAVLEVLLSVRDGGLQPARRLTFPGKVPTQPAVSDFDGDGRLDIVAIDGAMDGGVVVFLGDGLGGFGTPVRSGAPVVSAPGFSFWPASSFQIADVNRDGRLDLVLCEVSDFGSYDFGSYDLFLGMGKGDGSFGPFAPLRAPLTIWESFVVADINGDGWVDLVTGNRAYWGQHDGGFAAEPQSLADTRDTMFRIINGFRGPGAEAADFDHDGRADLVIGGEFGDGPTPVVTVVLDAARGSTAAKNRFPTGSVSSPYYVKAVDLNSDKNLDLVVGHFTGNYFTVLVGNGDGTFQAPVQVTQAAPLMGGVGDFDGDGCTDLVFPNYYDDTLSVLRNLNCR